MYDLRGAGDSCVDNPALALLDVLAKGEERVEIIVDPQDLPLKVVESVAASCGYRVAGTREEGGALIISLEKKL